MDHLCFPFSRVGQLREAACEVFRSSQGSLRASKRGCNFVPRNVTGDPRGQLITDLGLCVLDLCHLSMQKEKKKRRLALLLLQLKLLGPHKEQAQPEKERKKLGEREVRQVLCLIPECY